MRDSSKYILGTTATLLTLGGMTGLALAVNDNLPSKKESVTHKLDDDTFDPKKYNPNGNKPTPDVSTPAVTTNPVPTTQSPTPTQTQTGNPPLYNMTHSCRELRDKYGVTNYQSVMDYWVYLGRPADLDNDSDGYPCETVYGEQNPTVSGNPDALAGTHSCARLKELQFTYSGVMWYWTQLGRPTDMDDDNDGWPCESVYGQQ